MISKAQRSLCLSAIVLALISMMSCGNSDVQNSAMFVDTFDRGNTQLGLGEGWDLRGAYVNSFPLPPATDGFLSGGTYTYAGDSVVYAARKFDKTIHRMGAEGYWRRARDGAETSLAMAISPNDLLVSDMVHFAANRSVWNLTVRRNGGDFEPVASGRFTPALKLGDQYQFEIDATDDDVTVRVPGQQITSRVNTRGLLGPYLFWEEFPNDLPAGTVFAYNSVWAT